MESPPTIMRAESGDDIVDARLPASSCIHGRSWIWTRITDAGGQFSHTFTPTPSDGGLYQVSAIHPDITDRPRQRAFTINRVTFGPTPGVSAPPPNWCKPDDLKLDPRTHRKRPDFRRTNTKKPARHGSKWRSAETRKQEVRCQLSSASRIR